MKKFYRKKFYGKKNTSSSIILLIIILAGSYIYNEYKSTKALDTSEVKFAKCTDGDTAHFIIDGKDETVRFLAIDTPETVKPGTPVQPYGKEASNRTCELITNAKEIKLEYEDTNKTDKYGRHLAWVYADEVMIQEDLISKGYAKVAYLYGDYKYTGKLQEVEASAKTQGLGIWAK